MKEAAFMGKELVAAIVAAMVLHVSAGAQTIERITFDEAIQRAVANNPTIQQAAAGIVRAEAILQQAGSSTRPQLSASISATVIDPITRFSGASIFPRTQTLTTAEFAVPLLTPVRWAQRNQLADQVFVSQQRAGDVRREIAVATAQAYLAIIASRRVLELNERARDNAAAHYAYANQRYEGGIGSRLNALRAQQELSADEARVEDAQLAVRRAQEALGVLIAAPGPADAAEEPVFDVPADQYVVSGFPPPPKASARLAEARYAREGGSRTEAVAAGALSTVPNVDLGLRPDIRLLAARQSAAERVVSDSWKDYLPSVTGLFSPQVLAPAGLFANARSWRATALFSVPLLDSGFRRGQARERQALLDDVRAERANTERQATSEIRTAREAVAATERALARARQAAEQAAEVVRITDIAFREGATTNIEVLDAQRQARDAETQATIAEDAVHRARLELLVATGRFPSGI
jgi:outer membrane protein TolC